MRSNKLSETIPIVTNDRLNERARRLLKDRKWQIKKSETEIAEQLGWSQSKVAQKLGGRTPITLDELEQLCLVLRIQPTEVVRDHGLEFCAEMTPTELRFLERLRQLPPNLIEGLMGLLNVRPHTRMESRAARKPADRMKKIR